MKAFLTLFLLGAFSGSIAAQIGRLPINRTTYEITNIYRKPNKKEAQLLAPENEDLARFAAFLRLPNSGLTKLLADKGCADNTKVLVVSEDCLENTMPGSGISFSFRTREHRIPRLSDIVYTEESFQSPGVRLHGIFVNLGEVPIENVSLTTNGMKYLAEFPPETDIEKAKALEAKLNEGIMVDGFLYRRGLRTRDNATFALRSIAYRGEYYRALGGITYNEFNFDKRLDVIVVFRIVRRHPNGAVTILWRELSRNQSPKIELAKEDRPTPMWW